MLSVLGQYVKTTNKKKEHVRGKKQHLNTLIYILSTHHILRYGRGKGRLPTPESVRGVETEPGAGLSSSPQISHPISRLGVLNYLRSHPSCECLSLPYTSVKVNVTRFHISLRAQKF